jgi:hypothetical protein
MKVFHCDHCRHLLFFENVRCLGCDRRVAFVPELGVVASLEEKEGKWHSPLARARGKAYRLCANYEQQDVCNWALPDDDPNPLCRSCRTTRIFPDLSVPWHKEAWYKLEVAKRRLIYSLLRLSLPLANRSDDPERGLAFEFLADGPPGSPPVLTGHANGVITVNVAEADDAERERRRRQMYEPYRTLLGHFRHEIGHYYWDRLIKDGESLEAFRGAFGDERANYQESLQRHYDTGAPPDWQERFISAYASSHPWEDWAETWAHYLHMVDALQTASACGLSLRPPRRDEPSLKAPARKERGSFARMVEDWIPLTYVLNNLNRGLGLPDGYPFVLSAPVVAKIRFVHETVLAADRETID